MPETRPPRTERGTCPTREPHPIVTELRARRREAGLSQRAVANAIHYSHPAVTFWESGANRPYLDAVAAYAAVLGCRLVLGDSGEPIIDVLRQHRLDAGLRQSDVAVRLDCVLMTVNRWETGRRGLNLAAASEYAALFGLALELREVPDA